MHNAPELRIHPDTARRHGIAARDWVWIETPNEIGKARLEARLTDEVPPDIVATGMGWYFPEIPAPNYGALTFNVDAAIPYGHRGIRLRGRPRRETACAVFDG